MVKSVLGVHHAGLRDWMIQRLSAIYMAVYVFLGVIFFMLHPHLSFTEWHDFFSHTGVKVATLLGLMSLLLHAWVGLWTILTDYVQPFVLRAVLNVLVLLMLAACFAWGLLIMGSV